MSVNKELTIIAALLAAICLTLATMYFTINNRLDRLYEAHNATLDSQCEAEDEAYINHIYGCVHVDKITMEGKQL